MTFRHTCLLGTLAAAFAGGFYMRATAARPAEHAPTVSTSADKPPADDAFEKKIQPFLAQYCNSCHNADKALGGVTLDAYTSVAHARKDRKTWETVQAVVASGEMPPKKKPQPPEADRKFVTNWVETSLFKIDCTAPKDPGRVTLRRLNRAEFNNTIRDLCGVDFKPAEDFPSDDVGYGFDNIGDVLSVQPVLIEKYMTAADRILDAAIASLGGVKSEKTTIRPQQISTVPRSAKVRTKDDKGKDVVRIELTTEGAAFVEKQYFSADGEYTIRVKSWGKEAGGESPKLAIRIDGKDVKTTPVTAVLGKAEVFDVKVRTTAGDHRVAAVLANPTAGAKETVVRTLGVEFIEVEGPIGGGARPLPDSTKLVLSTLPRDAADNRNAAEKTLAAFARKAYRRPVTPAELARLMTLFDKTAARGEPFEKAVKLPLKAVLVSPNFLFRVEDDPKGEDESRTLNDHELAARLSYFVWSSMPDAELSAAADNGDLRKPGLLAAQIKRMLADRKSRALVENFAGQWLMLRSLRGLTPDPGTFKDWDEPLREAMIRETELFFQNIVSEDRSVLEFLDADYTFVNERLARHYGIPNIKGPEFRKVKLADGRRGGVVTQASVLTVTSNPTRTSPVKRGKWVLENLLGVQPPPPAPDVPELPPTGELKGTVRQQMEQHRANPACATCHVKLDPLGFGLENFDGVGKWRDEDNKFKIDASGVLPGGETFTGPAELRKVLLRKADPFRRCLAEKLLTFGLGRGLEYYDKCTLDAIVSKLKAGKDSFSALVLAVVESDPFQKRRGKRSE